MNNEITTDNMSNEEVIEVLKGLVFGSFDRTTRKERQALDLAIKALEERPHGKWIYINKEDKKKGFGGYCSICKCDMPIGINDWKQEYYESKYCPNCGAKMDGEGAEQ